MHLTRLILTNFKNYERQELSFSPRLNGLAGLNGMGKTNLLDAVYYTCLGKSHFGLTDSNVVRRGADFFRLEAYFEHAGIQEKIVAKVQPRRRKVFERNDAPYDRLSEHIGLIPVVIIVPDDTLILLEGSESRRRFLDNTLSQLDPVYLEQLIRYNKVLSQRNAALKQMAEQHRYQPELIAVYNDQLLAPAQYVYEQRRGFLERFTPLVQDNYRKICGQSESVDLAYQSRLHDAPLSELLAGAAEKDRILQRTTVGVHKDDLAGAVAGFPLKRYASQGQLKSFVLALKLSQYECFRREKNMRPLLLLDDIFDKLDQQRVAFLLELLSGRDFGQVFITDTHTDRLSGLIRQIGVEHCLFKVEHGAASLVADAFETN